MRTAATLPLLLALAVPLSACGGGSANTLDTPRLDSEIRTWAYKQSGGISLQSIKVVCPDGVTITPQATFHCLVTEGSLGQLRVTVTIEDRSGMVTWVMG